MEFTDHVQHYYCDIVPDAPSILLSLIRYLLRLNVLLIWLLLLFWLTKRNTYVVQNSTSNNNPARSIRFHAYLNYNKEYIYNLYILFFQLQGTDFIINESMYKCTYIYCHNIKSISNLYLIRQHIYLIYSVYACFKSLIKYIIRRIIISECRT